ncbi:elongation factor-like GTPase 1 [Macrosteles quadrilineatus]|uniref:elongation factor-like GTPase 1 n=1 Tax=Macrosteles quadrilineatus TaxID=74068 RepID=UPI0023E0FF43|nr:elongation factor-like GTPase 1 [Macrosteles quadrilineatus]
MRLVNIEKLGELQNKPSNIRNICIMAHVDHGKTTLADSLVASNGIISQRMAGKLRYLDSRKDEQERGITMKSSSIALYYKSETKNEEYLVNLIDSPGHVDFSSEVSTAVRLCDGAIIVVDVVEGVCPQTQVALKQAWLENIQPVLVLNKLDRLILEVKLSPLDAYVHLTQVLEQVNAVTASLFTTEVMNRSESVPSSGDQLQDWSDGLETADDSQLYFCPDQGNVVFASAADGWGFCVRDFAAVYAAKLGVKQAVLERTLWGDFYLNTKTKRIAKGAQEKAKKPLFVQLVLENIWAVYENIVVRKDKDKLVKMAESLNVKMTARDLRHTDSKVQLQAFCSQWLPLAHAVLEMVSSKLPSPCEITHEKVERLMCGQGQSLESLPPESQALKQAFLQCSSKPDAPVIVFISKMFPLERKLLPQNRPKPLTPEEIAKRREQARLRLANQNSTPGDGQPLPDVPPDGGGGIEGDQDTLPPPPAEEDDVFIAFARVFSGCLRRESTVYVLGPKHDPAVALQKQRQGEEIVAGVTLKDLKSGQHVTRVTLSDLYLMMGRELETLECVPAGNVLGIGGLEDHVLKTATLSSNLACPAFRELQLMAVPILRVAVETKRPSDLPALVRGLRLLNQADACVQVIVQETGEHVIVTAGEVHLERCIEDLQQRYAKVAINVSEPIVPFRETVVPPPTVDMVNEAIQDQQVVGKKESTDESVGEGGLVTIVTPNKQSVVRLRAAPLPQDITDLLENNLELLRTLDRVGEGGLYTPNKQSVVRLRAAPLPQDITDLLENNLELLRTLDRVGEGGLYTPNKQSVVRLRAAPLPQDITDLLENNLELLRTLDRVGEGGLYTPNKQSVVRLRAAPLPQDITDLLENNLELLRTLDRVGEGGLYTPNKQSVVRLRAAPLPQDITDLLENNLELLRTLGRVGEGGLYTPNKQSVVRLRAAPLPQDITDLLENNLELLRTLDRVGEGGLYTPNKQSVVRLRAAPLPQYITDLLENNLELLRTLDRVDEGGLYTPNKQSVVRLRAAPLPQDITDLLENNLELLRTLDRAHNVRAEMAEGINKLSLDSSTALDEKTKKAVEAFKNNIAEMFEKHGGEWSKKTVEEIWSFGPRRCGPNILINRIPEHSGRNVWSGESKQGCQPSLLEYDSSFVNGFQLATLAGPMCEEPMMGVAFVVEDWTIDSSAESNTSGVFGPLSGQIVSVVKDGCRKAFQAQPQRLMAAMYSCHIQANAEILGKMYAVLGRRHGRILHGDMTQGSASFTVEAVLPVVESFLFAPEMRKQTSGLASPQLVFSHWEVIDVDPYWEPRTEEEYLHYGEKADTENRARKYMDQVRRRKGLPVQQKIVQFAEKQRTLGKNK